MSSRLILLGTIGLFLQGEMGELLAQGHHHHNNTYRPAYRNTQQNHTHTVIRDSHGHTIGTYRNNVIPQNSQYVIPHSGNNHHGSYYYSNNTYYYRPQTNSTSHTSHYEPEVVRFGSFSHVDDLVSRLEEMMNELCLDLHYNYSHNRGFKETYSEAYEILEMVQLIHDDEHRLDRDAIRSRLSHLDQDFHHIQDDVKTWHRHANRQIGTAGIHSKMDIIESTIHHLMHDVGVHPSGSTTETAPRPDNQREMAPRPR